MYDVVSLINERIKMSEIKTGDWVTVNSSYDEITLNKRYEVQEIICEHAVIIKNDDNDLVGHGFHDVTLAPKPRPHAELIKKWADDDTMEIEFLDAEEWQVTTVPRWIHYTEYREKPSEPSECDLIMQDIQTAQDNLNAAKKRLQELEQ